MLSAGSYYGGVVFATFSFLCVMCFLEFLYALVICSLSDERAEKVAGLRRSYDEDSGGWFL